MHPIALGVQGAQCSQLPRAQGLVQKLESPLSIAIVGEFNAGKSTLLNALLEEDLLPVGVLPTTAHTGIVRFGPRRAARLHLLDAPSREVNFEEAARVMKDNSADVARVDFMFPHPVLRSLEFWDTPGFNALEERHETVAANALETAEAILWVMDANQVLSATEFDRIDGLRHGVERLVVVVNKVDRLGRDREGKTQELLDYIDDNIGDQIAGAFAVSAKEAIDARPGKDGAFEDFRAYVNEHIVERAGRIKVIEVFFSLTGLFHDVRRFSADRQTSLTEAKRQLGEVGDWLTTDVQSTLERFVEDTRRHLEDRTTFMLDSIEREIADAMRPSGQLVTRHALSKTDAIFVGRLFVDRYHDILKVAFQETARVVDELEATMARRVENVVRLMSAEEARGQNRSLESLFDELRMHRAILEERLVGRLSARFTATVELVGPEVLMSIDGDKAMWRPKLRRLLPDSSQLGSTELTDWLRDWTSRMTVFILRLDAELAWISMDLEQRLNVDSMISWLESDAMSTTLHD